MLNTATEIMDLLLSTYASQQFDLIKLSSALSTPLIALLGVLIACGQLKTARRKLKLDLFEKRLEIFQTVSKSLSFAIFEKCSTEEERLLFWQAAQNSKWLFDEEISTQLKLLFSETDKIARMQERRNFLAEEFRLKKDASSQMELDKMDQMLTEQKKKLAKLQAKLELSLSPFLSISSLAKD